MRHRRGNQRDTLIFIAISVILMLIADQTIFGGKRSYIEKVRQEYYAEHPDAVPPAPVMDRQPPPPEDHSLVIEQETAPPVVLEPDYRDLPPPEPIFPLHGETFSPSAAAPVDMAGQPPSPPVQTASLPPVAPPPRGKGGKIAIIIDDVGMNLKNSREAVALPAPITLAFLPYAPHTPDLARQAEAAGHQAMIHTPMEAIGDNGGLGPMALRSGMDGEQLRAELDKMFASFDGYRGINNHMGSKLTQDAVAMDVVMNALKARGLYFVDSKTIAGSVAADRARAAGIPYAVRDVFLDHEETPEFVARALAHLVQLAKANGSAIAIGHPKDVTLNGLRAWLPTLKDKGVELVPVSDLLIRPAAGAVSSAAMMPSATSAAAPVQPPAPLPAVQP
jgi:polysaccharide deacetylase 2 family uncharacterized protein YibQ